MLRLLDSRTTDVIVWPQRDVPVHITVACPAGTLREVRAVLVADLIRRVLQDRHGFATDVTLTGTSGQPNTGLRRDLASLWVSPPDQPNDSNGQPHLVVDTGQLDPGDTPSLMVGPVTPIAMTLSALNRARYDRLAIRLALLAAGPNRPISLSPTRLNSAARTLRRWRRRVAGWAAHPPADLPADMLDSAHAAMDDNMNITGVLSVLTRIERDLTIQPGAKLEMFLRLDRILALDLARHHRRGLSQAQDACSRWP